VGSQHNHWWITGKPSTSNLTMCLAIDAKNTVEIWGFYFGIIYHILEIRFGIFLRAAMKKNQIDWFEIETGTLCKSNMACWKITNLLRCFSINHKDIDIYIHTCVHIYIYTYCDQTNLFDNTSVFVGLVSSKQMPKRVSREVVPWCLLNNFQAPGFLASFWGYHAIKLISTALTVVLNDILFF